MDTIKKLTDKQLKEQLNKYKGLVSENPTDQDRKILQLLENEREIRREISRRDEMELRINIKNFENQNKQDLLKSSSIYEDEQNHVTEEEIIPIKKTNK